MRAAYIIEIQPSDIASLAFAAGVLVAQGVSQGQVIADMLDNIQMVEVPDDFIEVEGQVIDFPALDEQAYPQLSALANEVDFPGAPEGEFAGEEADPEDVARILAEITPPPPESTPVYYPFNRQADFGAGPGPRE